MNTKEKASVLLITPSFSPNVGGVETHLDDLVSALDKRGYSVFVHTYSPITTEGVAWKSYEDWGTSSKVRRYRWIGKGLFHIVENYPFIDFLYLTPYLLIRTFIWLLFNRQNIDVIHAQGLNSALIGVVLKKFFGIRLVVSTHAVYEFSEDSLTPKFSKWVLSHADKVICLSRASYDELVRIGIEEVKLDEYDYWIDLDTFKPGEKEKSRRELGLPSKFTVLFVGRLIRKKGILELLEAAGRLPDLNFVFVGDGPEKGFLKKVQKKESNVIFLGRVPNKKLPVYYSAANIFCIPSQYEEGLGRVNMEAVACGTPVVGANKGGIPEVLDSSVSILVDPTPDNLEKALRTLFEDEELYTSLKEACRAYAKRNFSEDNVEDIIRYY